MLVIIPFKILGDWGPSDQGPRAKIAETAIWAQIAAWQNHSEGESLREGGKRDWALLGYARRLAPRGE